MEDLARQAKETIRKGTESIDANVNIQNIKYKKLSRDFVDTVIPMSDLSTEFLRKVYGVQEHVQITQFVEQLKTNHTQPTQPCAIDLSTILRDGVRIEKLYFCIQKKERAVEFRLIHFCRDYSLKKNFLGLSQMSRETLLRELINSWD